MVNADFRRPPHKNRSSHAPTPCENDRPTEPSFTVSYRKIYEISICVSPGADKQETTESFSLAQLSPEVIVAKVCILHLAML